MCEGTCFPVVSAACSFGVLLSGAYLDLDILYIGMWGIQQTNPARIDEVSVYNDLAKNRHFSGSRQSNS